MDATNIISLLGGVAMFLFGMSVMGDSLKKVAGSKMEMILFKLAGNTPKAERSIRRCSARSLRP